MLAVAAAMTLHGQTETAQRVALDPLAQQISASNPELKFYEAEITDVAWLVSVHHTFERSGHMPLRCAQPTTREAKP